MTHRRRLSSPACLVAASRSRCAGALDAQAIQRVDVRQRRRTRPARRSPTSARPTSSSARTTSRAKCCSVEPADEPMQIALLVDNSQAARNYISRHARRRCRRSSTRSLTDRAACKNEVAIIAIGERPTIITELHVRPGAAAARASSGSSPQRGSGAYLLDGDRRNQPGLQEARRAAAGDRRDHDRRAGVEQPAVRSGARAAARSRRRVPRDRDRPAVDRLSDERAIATSCSTEGPRDSGGRYDTLLTEHGARRAG